MDPSMFKSQTPKLETPSVAKRFLNKIGINVKTKVTVFNASDTMAYVMISDVPLHHMTGVGISDVSVNRELIGSYKSQCTYLAPAAERKFELFTDKIYHSVYFKMEDGTGRLHHVDRLHNAFKRNINILQSHVAESQPATIPV